jgi:conjugal transfer/entry exclusion protein
MAQPLLNGVQEPEYLEDSGPDQLEVLRQQIGDLQEDVNALKAILMRQYGEFKAAFSDQAIVTTDASDKWAAIKSRMPPRHAQAVDVLLLQGSMKRTQIASALKMDYANCAKNVIQVLKSQGWIVEQNGNLSLKQL